MSPQQEASLARVTEHFSRDPEVLGLILGGSLAHGYASPSSDIDVMIVVSEDNLRDRLGGHRTCYYNRELCTYPEGYVDGKYTSEAFIERVAQRGSEPARFAFQDARVLFSLRPTLAPALTRAGSYPADEQAPKLRRFEAQFEAWYWYTGEALKRGNLPLLRTAVSKLSLFGGRIVLAHNQRLYPYHKWFLRVLADCPEKPANLLASIESLAQEPTRESIDLFAQAIRSFRPWQASHATWPAQFMQDSELNWMDHPAPVDDA